MVEMNIQVYTDGSIVGGNPGGAGGWAFVITTTGKEMVRSGMIESSTTNNRAEMTALIEAMRAFKRPATMTVYSDSEYLIKPLASRKIEEYAARNFSRKIKKSKYGGRSGPHSREQMPNADLWEEINRLDIYHNATYQHVRGHSGDRFNEICHEAALSAARVAWAAHEKGLYPVPLPDSLEGRERLMEVIKDVPTPPDPPVVERPRPWAVFERKTRYRFFAKPASRPISPEEHEDGGEAYCKKAAEKMNRTNGQEVARMPRYEARPLDAPLDDAPFAPRLEAV